MDVKWVGVEAPGKGGQMGEGQGPGGGSRGQWALRGGRQAPRGRWALGPGRGAWGRRVGAHGPQPSPPRGGQGWYAGPAGRAPSLPSGRRVTAPLLPALSTWALGADPPATAAGGRAGGRRGAAGGRGGRPPGKRPGSRGGAARGRRARSRRSYRSAWCSLRRAGAPPSGGRGDPSARLAGGRGPGHPRPVEGRSERPSRSRSPPQRWQPPQPRTPLPNPHVAAAQEELGGGACGPPSPRTAPQGGPAHPQPSHRTVSGNPGEDTGQIT